ncbi:MAG: hypothetical protein J6Y13_02750, partial [Treponema sp.]|nr:hypothetical protein [Treponema sp.]
MESFTPLVMKIAYAMAVLSIVWQGIQLCFGTLETRKFAASMIMKPFIFLLVLSLYPLTCAFLKDFALSIGQNGNKETAEAAIAMFNSRLEELGKDQQSLDDLINGNKDSAVYQASAGRDGDFKADWRSIAEATIKALGLSAWDLKEWEKVVKKLRQSVSMHAGTGMSEAEIARAKAKQQE